MARIYLATEENQKTIINNQGALKQDHVDLKNNQNEILKKLNQGGDSDISTMAAAWIQGVNAHVSNWIVSSGKVGQVLNKLGGGLYSAINNCTTVKQVLDNAATWQQMVKNNLIVYCIEQSDDFMKTLVDYPNRLYELVSNEYMQKLMAKSSRCQEYTMDNLKDNGPIKGEFIPVLATPSDADLKTSYFYGKYRDGSNLEIDGKNIGKIINLYLNSKKMIAELSFGSTGYGSGGVFSVYVYSPTKPTI